MKVQLTSDELHRPASYAARRLVRAQLAVVVDTGDRCVNKKRDALHDFRVAVRRLRTWLEGYDSSLCDTVPKQIAKKLHRLQGATNSARDIEVQYLWIKQQLRHSPTLAKRKRAKRLLRDLRRQSRKERRAVNTAIQDKLPRIAKQLRRAVAYHCVCVDTPASSESSMALATAQALMASSQELHDRVTHITSVDDVSQAHRARIAAKHLRYLLEPLRDSSQAAQRAVDHLTTIQDGIGELRDATALQPQIADAKKSSAFMKQARTRVQLAREQYRALDIPAILEQARSDVSAVVASLHTTTPFTKTLQSS